MSALPLRDGGSIMTAVVPVVVDLPARVSGQCLRALRGQLLAGLHHPGGFVVHCRQVQELSPAAQALLVAAHRAARLRGVTWRLEQPTAAMLTALRRSGLSHLLLVPVPGRAAEPARQHDRPTARPPQLSQAVPAAAARPRETSR